MKRKKGEQREEGGGLVCHGLRVSLCASSSPRRGLRWVGADVPIFPAWPGAGCGVRAPGAGLASSLQRGAGLPGQRFHTSPPVVPTQTAGFQAKPQGSVFHVATAHPPPAQHCALCQTPLTPCSPLLFREVICFALLQPAGEGSCCWEIRNAFDVLTLECSNSAQQRPPAHGSCLRVVLLLLRGCS